MRAKFLKKKIILALCLGAVCSAATGHATTVGTDIRTNTTDAAKGYEVPDGTTTITIPSGSITGSVDNSGMSGANTSARAYGVYNDMAGTVTLQGQGITGQYFPITASATGGTATSADAFAYGIVSFDTSTTKIGGAAEITVVATGGSATSTSANTYANASAYGIASSFGSSTTKIDGAAKITVAAIGGRATATFASAYANAYGISTSYASTTKIGGAAEITVAATGGSATSASASTYATASGIDNRYDSTTIIAGNAEITVTATGGSATAATVDAKAQASGIFNISGTVNLQQNATITATATVKQSGAHAYAYSLYAKGGTTNINQAAGHPYTVELTGDVLATGGTINVALNNSNSFLRGNVIVRTGGTVNLSLANQAVWQPVYDDRNGTITYATDNSLSGYSTTKNTISTLALDGGIIDLTWDNPTRTSYRTLTLNSVSGSGGNVRIATNLADNTGDMVATGTLNSAANLKVGVTYDRSLSTITQPTTLYATSYTPVSASAGANNLTVTGVTTDSGAFSLMPTFSGTSLTSLTVGVGSNTKAAASSASSQSNMLQTSINHLRKRLGDLRDAPETEDGIWARIYSGEVSNDKYTSVESAYKGMQLGYDKSREVKDGRTYTGGAVSYTEADNSFYRGSGESKNSDLALYQTWVGNDGHYYDLIAKHGRLASDYHVTDLSNNYSTADYHTRTSSLSAEYGYRKQLKDGWYLEPQVELTYGHINGVNYTTSTGMSVKQDGIDHLIGRMGLGLGKKLTTGANLYTSLSVLHEFNGDENIKADTLTYSQDMGGTWCEFILGASGKLSKHSTGYVNLEKLFGGDVSSGWQFNAGCRWSF
ncbi:MAG: prn 1 [Firmicutes bacterium]|nr:prn 1 [Bacillota bacterium]